MSPARRIGEVVAIVAAYSAARLVIDELDVTTGLGYYGCWGVPLAALALVAPPPRLVPARAVWTSATLAIVALALAASDALHGGKLARAALALWHAPLLEPSWTSPAGTPLWAHAVFGVLVGVLRWRTGALAPGIAMHALFNALWVIAG